MALSTGIKNKLKEKKKRNKSPINLTSTVILFICICRTIMPFSARHILAILFAGKDTYGGRVPGLKNGELNGRKRERER